MKEFGYFFRNVKGKVDSWIEADRQRAVDRYQSPLSSVILYAGGSLPEDDASYNWGMSASMTDFVHILRTVQLLKEGDNAARQLDENVTERAQIATAYLLSLSSYQPTYWNKALFSLEANGWDIESVKLNQMNVPSQYETENIEELQDAFLSLDKEVLDQVGVHDSDSLRDVFASFQTDAVDDEYLRELLLFAFENGYDAPPMSTYLTIAGFKYSNIELHDKRDGLLEELKSRLTDQGTA